MTPMKSEFIIFLTIGTILAVIWWLIIDETC